MDYQIEAFKKLMDQDDEPLVPADVENTLDKLINITRVAQFEQLNLDDNGCERVIKFLDEIETKQILNSDYIKKITTAKAEFIPIVLLYEDFI